MAAVMAVVTGFKRPVDCLSAASTYDIRSEIRSESVSSKASPSASIALSIALRDPELSSSTHAVWVGPRFVGDSDIAVSTDRPSPGWNWPRAELQH